jgi:GNAT superfamily N-acetyltransferase
MTDWQIEPFTKDHERGEFYCGKESLDEFLRSLVSQYEKRKLGRTYVAVPVGQKKVYGYYTLASAAVSFSSLPVKTSKKLPRHPVPVVLLGRLAVDQSMQGQGLGRTLLMDALKRVLELSERLGVFAVEVKAIDREAMEFYQRYGFVPLLDDELHLFLPTQTIAEAMAK